MCPMEKSVDCRDALVEVGLIALFVILATLSSLLVVPMIM